MKESKDRKLSELNHMINAATNASHLSRLHDERDEVEGMRFWPINTRILSKLSVCAIVHIFMNFRTDIYGLVIKAAQNLGDSILTHLG